MKTLCNNKHVGFHSDSICKPLGWSFSYGYSEGKLAEFRKRSEEIEALGRTDPAKEAVSISFHINKLIPKMSKANIFVQWSQKERCVTLPLQKRAVAQLKKSCFAIVCCKSSYV